MSTLYIAEFTKVGTDKDGVHAQAALAPPVQEQTVAIAANAATPSLGFKTNTSLVRLTADAVCSVLFTPASGGANASASNMRIAANMPEYFAVTPGSGLTVSVITNS